MNDRELDRIIASSEQRVRENGSQRNRLSALQLRIRAARLQTASVQDYSELDPEIHRAVCDAAARLQFAEDLAAQRLGKVAA